MAFLARIIQEADIVCHNINERQYLWLSYPKHRVLKPEAQAKGSAQFSSRVLKLHSLVAPKGRNALYSNFVEACFWDKLF